MDYLTFEKELRNSSFNGNLKPTHPPDPPGYPYPVLPAKPYCNEKPK